jgi:hypothetical protein
MLNLGNSLGQDRIKLVMGVLLLQVLYNRPACEGDGQENAKRKGGYCRARGSIAEEKLTLAGVNLRLGALGWTLGEQGFPVMPFGRGVLGGDCPAHIG